MLYVLYFVWDKFNNEKCWSCFLVFVGLNEFFKVLFYFMIIFVLILCIVVWEFFIKLMKILVVSESVFVRCLEICG